MHQTHSTTVENKEITEKLTRDVVSTNWIRLQVEKMPPVIIEQPMNDVKKTLADVRSWGKEVYFRMIRGQQAVVTSSKEDFKFVRQKLSASKIKYFTYTPASEKIKKVVLKGLPSVYSEEEVKVDLETQASDVISVSLMKSRSFKGEARSNCFLVSFPWSTNIGEMQQKVQYILFHRIKWEEYVKPHQYRNTQCFNCQEFGHAAYNCGKDSKCVKCGGPHESKKCSKSKEEPAKCANCGQNHPANYRGCEKHKEFEKLKKPQKKSAKKKPSYRDVVKGNVEHEDEIVVIEEDEKQKEEVPEMPEDLKEKVQRLEELLQRKLEDVVDAVLFYWRPIQHAKKSNNSEEMAKKSIIFVEDIFELCTEGLT